MQIREERDPVLKVHEYLEKGSVRQYETQVRTNFSGSSNKFVL